MPPLYGMKSIMKYLEIQCAKSFYGRVQIGMPIIKICGRIESSTELIDEWRTKLAKGYLKKLNNINNKIVK